MITANSKRLGQIAFQSTKRSPVDYRALFLSQMGARRQRSTQNHEQSLSQDCQFLERRVVFHRNRSLFSTSSRSTNRKPDRAKVPDIRRAKETITAILREISEAQHRPGSDNSKTSQRILNETMDLSNSLVVAAESGLIKPSGKHGKELSRILGSILQTHNQIGSNSLLYSDNIFDFSREILKLLEKWNLNFQDDHYRNAITIANREGRWSDAANLFWKQIDPQAGFNPVHFPVEDPQGLYAIVRLAQQEGSSVADLVFDAVMQLAMVSPQDQITYVLAAGNALGQAGEWESVVEYVRTSFSSGRLGTPLIASAMQACVLSGKPEEALAIYNEMIGSKQRIAEEWQWGGEKDVVDPLTRDMFMRVIAMSEDSAQDALTQFHLAVQDRVMISYEALRGVVWACELNGDLEGALSILEYLLENESRPGVVVKGSMLFIDAYDNDTIDNMIVRMSDSDVLPVIAEILASIARISNSQGSFGTGILCLRRCAIAMDSKHSDSVVGLLGTYGAKSDLVGPIMTALCSLRCDSDAVGIFQNLYTAEGHEPTEDVDLIHKFAEQEITKYGQTRLANAWNTADRNIGRLLRALNSISQTPGDLAPHEKDTLLKILASAMQACTASHQSDVSLRLLSLVETKVSEKNISKTDISRKNDFLTAQIVTANSWVGNTKEALDLFETILNENRHRMSEWRSTSTAGLAAMVARGRGKEAVEIFRELDEQAKTPDSFSFVGSYFARIGDAAEIGELYKQALESGNLSEDLCLLAMSAVAKSKIDNRLRVLRALVDDTAQSAGMDRNKWMKTRYWNVKRELGFYYARLLMWWNDPGTCHLDELNLAISDFYERKQNGLKAKYEVLRVITENAKTLDVQYIQSSETQWEHIPTNDAAWIQLLETVVEESKFLTFTTEAAFIDDMVFALRNFNGNKELMHFISTVLKRNADIRKDTLNEALRISKMEENSDILEDLEALVSTT